MRTTAANPETQQRRNLSRRWLIQAIGAAMLGMILPGCAISPSNGASQGTLLQFTVTLKAPIPFGSQNIYAIVMNLGQGSTSPPAP